MWRILEKAIPPFEEAFLRAVVSMRNLVAHHQTVPVDMLEKVSMTWERLRVEREAVPGWAWPRCGQRLAFVAGRTFGDALTVDAGLPPQVGFEALVRKVEARLAAGEDAFVDVGSLEAPDLDRLVALVPSDIEVLRLSSAVGSGERRAA